MINVLALWLLLTGISHMNFSATLNNPTTVYVTTEPSDYPPHQDPQSRLIRDLFARYDNRIRPVRSYSTPVNITLTMSLYQLVQVNEPEEYFVINTWMAHTWYDEFLAWNPRNYDNISYIVVPWGLVWLSDIVLYNGLDMDYIGSERRINVELTMEPQQPGKARIRFAFPAVYRFNCKMDMYYFPFDKHNCTMVFGSWVYDSRFVEIFPHATSVKMENFISNQEWDVISFTSYRHVLNYTCCPYPYSNVQYHFYVQRKPLFFVCNYVIPTIIVAFVSILGSFMPGTTTGERTEKVTLGISTCLAMSILLLMVSDRLPTAGNYVPMMAWFFIVVIAYVAVAICFTTVVIVIQRRGRYGSKLDPKMRYIFFEVLGRLLLVEMPPQYHIAAVAAKARMRSDQPPVGRISPHPSIAPLANGESQRVDDSAPQTERNKSVKYYVDSCSANDTGFGVEKCGSGVDEGPYTRLLQNGSIWPDLAADVRKKLQELSGPRGGVKSASQNSSYHRLVRRLSSVRDLGINEWEVMADVVERMFLVAFMAGLITLSFATFVTAVASMERPDSVNVDE